MSVHFGRAASVEPYETEPEKVTVNEPETDANHASQSGARPKNLAAGRRPITHNLDKHDTMILDLKSQTLGDTQISRILNHDGGNYHSKTIGTRYRRIRLAKMAHNDEPLELNKMYWTEEELLLKSYTINVERHERERAREVARFFEDIAFSVNDLEKNVFYSPEACKRRYDDLISGKAKPHPNIDQNPYRARDDAHATLAVHEKKWAKVQAKKTVDWETVLVNEAAGKRVCKTPGKKRASGKRRPAGQRPAKKQKLDKELSDEMVCSEDDSSGGSSG
ncbi:hypothetical protein HDK77DRAFT_152198 [Phyllosticta capitalensis]